MAQLRHLTSTDYFGSAPPRCPDPLLLAMRGCLNRTLCQTDPVAHLSGRIQEIIGKEFQDERATFEILGDHWPNVR